VGEENSLQLKTPQVAKSSDTAEAIRKLDRHLRRDLRRCETLQAAVDVAFGEGIFLARESPTSPRNLSRFKIYFNILKQLTMLKIRLIHEFMRVHGINPDNPHEMWARNEVIVGSGRVPLPAASPCPPNSYAHRTTGGQSVQVVSDQVARLAERLTGHTHAHKGPCKMERYN